MNGPISQYSFENGRSACTCMAFAAAELFLDKIAKDIGPTQIVDSTFLQSVVLLGVEKYQVASLNTSVDHLSAEEVLSTGCFPRLSLSGSIRQGILSNDAWGAQGLEETIQGCKLESKWCCVVITKPPETVVVCLPPSSSSGRLPHILIDSHPRPHLFGTQESYARIHHSFDDLCTQSLRVLFSVVDLGEDVASPIAAAMYNCFDTYALVLN